MPASIHLKRMAGNAGRERQSTSPTPGSLRNHSRERVASPVPFYSVTQYKRASRCVLGTMRGFQKTTRGDTVGSSSVESRHSLGQCFQIDIRKSWPCCQAASGLKEKGQLIQPQVLNVSFNQCDCVFICQTC